MLRRNVLSEKVGQEILKVYVRVPRRGGEGRGWGGLGGMGIKAIHSIFKKVL